MEYKSADTFIQGIDGRTVTGITSVFGNVDDNGDICHPGMFTKSLQSSQGRIRHLWNHDDKQPPTAVIRDIHEVGRSELPGALLSKCPDATGGLLVKREYLDTPRGNEVLAGIQSGAIREMSIGHTPTRVEYQSLQHPIETLSGPIIRVRHLLATNLFESSDVLWGMNAATVAQKGFTPCIERLNLAIDAARALVGQRGELKSGRMISAVNEAKIRRVIKNIEEQLAQLETLLDDTAQSKALLARLDLYEHEFRWLSTLN